MEPVTTTVIFTSYAALVAVASNPVIQGWASDVAGGLTDKLLEGIFENLEDDPRDRLSAPAIRKRVAGALERAIACSLSELGRELSAEQQQAFGEALRTWAKNETVQYGFGRLLDPHKEIPLDLAILTKRFEAIAPTSSLKGLELNFPAFLTLLAGCFQEVVKQDEVLSKHFELTELEALVQQAVKQSGIQAQIEENTALSNRLQAMQIHEQKQTNQHPAAITDLLEEPARETARAQSAARQAWLEVISSECSNILLQGLDTDTADAERAKKTRLSGIYIALNTTARVEKKRGRRKAEAEHNPYDRLRREDSRPLTVLRAIATTPRMVLLGAPGSGKSTCIRHLALSLAQGQLATEADDRQKWQQQLSPLKGDQLERLPVVVVLRELAAWLAKHEPELSATHLSSSRAQALLKRYLGQWCPSDKTPQCLEDVWRALESGQALLLLDGLDELPPTGPRIGQIKALLESLAEGWSKTPMVVTCRVLSWQDPRWKLGPHWQSYELDALNDEQIADFIRRWCEQLAEGGHIENAGEKIQPLQQAVQRPDLRILAGNPLLLTVMAQLHGKRGLPDSRVELYEQAVDLLLERWELTNKPDLDRSRALQDWLSRAPCHMNDLKRALSRLAFDAHKRKSETEPPDEETAPATADIPENELVLELARLHERQELVWVERGIELIKERPGLLLESQPGIYHFPHCTFQEHLAARHLSGQGDYAKQAQALANLGSYWWEVLRLSVERLVQGEVGDKALALIAALCPEQLPAKVSANAWRQIWLAGDLLKSIRRYAESESLGMDLLERTRTRLVCLLEMGELTPRERHEAGLILGHLDDPRLGLEKPENWIWIPPGEFWMGDDKGTSDEKPAHKVTIAQGFHMSRFPVTNHDFKAFMDGGGYRQKKWWSEYGWYAGKERKLEVPDTWANVQCNNPNQPVVGVSWYGADAFCRWMSTQSSRLPPGTSVVRLPTETEWEYAARGKEGRPYPWGDEEPFPELANYDETGLGQTSPVGAFPLGATPEGLLDMSGNVWEWVGDYSEEIQTDLLDRNPVSYRMLRGGSCTSAASDMRGAGRRGGWTPARTGNVGFRVVRVPTASNPP